MNDIVFLPARKLSRLLRTRKLSALEGMEAKKKPAQVAFFDIPGRLR